MDNNPLLKAACAPCHSQSHSSIPQSDHRSTSLSTLLPFSTSSLFFFGTTPLSLIDRTNSSVHSFYQRRLSQYSFLLNTNHSQLSALDCLVLITRTHDPTHSLLQAPSTTFDGSLISTRRTSSPCSSVDNFQNTDAKFPGELAHGHFFQPPTPSTLDRLFRHCQLPISTYSLSRWRPRTCKWRRSSSPTTNG